MQQSLDHICCRPMSRVSSLWWPHYHNGELLARLVSSHSQYQVSAWSTHINISLIINMGDWGLRWILDTTCFCFAIAIIMLCGYIAYILSYIIRIDTIYCITSSHLFSRLPTIAKLVLYSGFLGHNFLQNQTIWL